MSEIKYLCPHCELELSIRAVDAMLHHTKNYVPLCFCKRCKKQYTFSVCDKLVIHATPNIPGMLPCDCEICKAALHEKEVEGE